MNENGKELINKIWKDYNEIDDFEVKQALLESLEKTVETSTDFTCEDHRLMLLGHTCGFFNAL